MFSFTNHKDKKHFCMHCLQCFSSSSYLNKHMENCIVINGVQAIQLPKEGEKVYFKNHKKNNYLLLLLFMQILNLLLKK